MWFCSTWNQLGASNPEWSDPMPEKNLQELFNETLKDIYFAEKKILTALPKMAKAAQAKELKAAFEKHEKQTHEHVSRLERVFAEINQAPRGKTCDAILGIIEEGQEVMKEFKGKPALNAGLLAAAQAVEHYEIARYGTLKTWAGELGFNQSAKLLEETLAEEKETDQTLTELAENGVKSTCGGCLDAVFSRVAINGPEVRNFGHAVRVQKSITNQGGQ
jgi:ferritin-like metal-binding protein YciE